MRIDFQQKILAHDSTPMKAEGGTDFTLANAAVIALDAVTEETKTLTPDEKYHRGQLAARIYRAKEALSIDIKEISLIKELIGKTYGPHIVHEAWNLLAQAAEGDEPKEPTPRIPGSK